ncbi:hypothetical protein PMAYCL1PPCAC_31703, partial [Pristionchus mayeri]
MDILSLPDVFIRQLMRTIGIKDRMRLRLTCRTFANLVSESHAGYFASGHIFTYCDNEVDKLAIAFGEEVFKISDNTEDQLHQIVHFRKHLFRGVSFRKFTITLKAHVVPLNFSFHFTDGFKIGVLWYHVNSESELE